MATEADNKKPKPTSAKKASSVNKPTKTSAKSTVSKSSKTDAKTATPTKKPAVAAKPVVKDSTTADQPTKSGFKDRLRVLGVKRKPSKKFMAGIGIGVVVVVVATLVGFGVMIYKYRSDNRAVDVAATIIPYPAVSVNGSPLWNVATYHQYLFELASIKKYLKYQGTDINSEDGKKQFEDMKKQILTRLENNLIYAQGARQYGITVSQKEVDDQYNSIVTQAGGIDKVKTTLTKLYGWTIDDFKDKIRDGVLQQKLGDRIVKDDKLNATAQKQADDIIKQLDAGADFAELAKKESTDAYASNGGDIGFVSKGQLGIPELDDVIFKLEVGQHSGVIKTQYGFHIVKVTDKKDDQVRVSQILIKATDLDSWLKDQRSKAKIVEYIKV